VKEFAMKYSPLVLLALLVSCTKNIDAPLVKAKPATNQKPETCTFGIEVFNKIKRGTFSGDYSLKKKPKDNELIAPPNATILLDFDGQVISNTMWNTKGDINAGPANLTDSEIDRVIKRVSEDFSPFNVTVTTDEDIYQATNPYKRMRVVITESWEWFGVVGGTSYNNSFTWGNNTPCFVFSTLLNYNEKYIAEAISHETGHTLGLLHQALYDDNCNFLSEYNEGSGEGPTGWAPIMGIGYYENITTWHKGPTVLGCNVIQDDVSIISATLGLLPDENIAMNKLKKIDIPAEGIINNSDDVDYYLIDLKQPATIIASPDCLPNGEGGNLCLKMSVYDKQGVLIKTIKDTASLSASTMLTNDKYYISVETEANQNQSRYGMLGKYTLRVE
jgi:hypothetical protein